MSEHIEDLRVGQAVELEFAERGTIQRIDYDQGMVYVAVPVKDGESVIDVDPSELWFQIVR